MCFGVCKVFFCVKSLVNPGTLSGFATATGGLGFSSRALGLRNQKPPEHTLLIPAPLQGWS